MQIFNQGVDLKKKKKQIFNRGVNLNKIKSSNEAYTNKNMCFFKYFKNLKEFTYVDPQKIFKKNPRYMWILRKIILKIHDICGFSEKLKKKKSTYVDFQKNILKISQHGCARRKYFKRSTINVDTQKNIFKNPRKMWSFRKIFLKIHDLCGLAKNYLKKPKTYVGPKNNI